MQSNALITPELISFACILEIDFGIYAAHFRSHSFILMIQIKKKQFEKKFFHQIKEWRSINVRRV